MIPVLFKIGPISVYSFGLMMGIAFIVANYFFAREMRRRGMSEESAGAITLIALVAGVAGSKLFSLIENFKAFISNPMDEIFSAAGLTFYGGLILATLCIYIYVRRKRMTFALVADAAAPSLIIAYGIGRIGCQLAGDGDYGIPSKLPWAMRYPEGTVSTIVDSAYAVQMGKKPNLELAARFREMYPNEPVPRDIAVHPAPVYETLAALVIFALLWKLRKKPRAAGGLFAIYLIAAGIERFLVELIRLNDHWFGLLSEAQVISLLMILGGIMMLYVLRNAPKLEFPAEAPSRTAAARSRAGAPVGRKMVAKGKR